MGSDAESPLKSYTEGKNSIDDYSSFPPMGEILNAWNEAANVIEASFGSVSDEQLQKPVGFQIPLEDQTIMEAEQPLLPKLDTLWHHPEARPVGRPGDGAKRMFGGVTGNFLFQGEAALEGAGLGRGPGADLGILRATGEIGVRLFVACRLDSALDTYLMIKLGPQSDETTELVVVENWFEEVKRSDPYRSAV